MKYKYLIIDCQNLFWRAFSVSLKDVLIKDNLELAPNAIKTGIKMIQKLSNQYGYEDSPIYLLFDNPESSLKIRKIIDEDYKSIRLKKSAPKGLYPTLKFFIHILRYFSDHFYISVMENCEADDLTKPILEQLPIDKFNKALCISNDLDWARNVDDNVDWFNWDKIYTNNKFKQKFGFIPVGKSIQMYKAIHGDRSDSIENAVKNLPKNILLDIVEKYEDMDTLFKEIRFTSYPEKWKQKIMENEERIRKNFQLVDFIPIDIDIEHDIFQSKRNIKMLRILYSSLNIKYEPFMEESIFEIQN